MYLIIQGQHGSNDKSGALTVFLYGALTVFQAWFQRFISVISLNSYSPEGSYIGTVAHITQKAWVSEAN